MTTLHLIEFTKFSGPMYTGRARGENAREKINLDSLENIPTNSFKVVLPNNFFTITSSFFLGLFTPSIQKMKSREEFLRRFDLQAFPSDLKKAIHDWIDIALMDKTRPYL